MSRRLQSRPKQQAHGQRANQKAAETPDTWRGTEEDPLGLRIRELSQAVAKVTSDWGSSCPSVAAGIALLLELSWIHADATNYVQEMQRCSFPGTG